MNIQIFGKNKCFDTKKAERYFKERRIKVQNIDLLRYGMSVKEFESVKNAVGGYKNMIDYDSKEYKNSTIEYLAYDKDKEQKVFENPEVMKTPIVRNGKKATIGYCPEIWKQWEEEDK